MPTLTIIVGLPGSGKTTYARKAVKDDVSNNTVRVNRDDLRKMTIGKFFSEDPDKIEPMISAMEKAAAQAAITQGFNVLIDATNLHPKGQEAWRERAEEWGASFSSVHLDVDVEECIRRDQERFATHGERLVGREVIERMANARITK